MSNGDKKNDSDPLRITLLMPLAEQRGGAELALVHLLEQGRDKDVVWQVIFTEDGPLVAQIRNFGIETQCVPTGRVRDLHRWPGTVARIAAHARRHRADAVFSWMTISHLVGGPAARLIHVPALWFQHGLASPRDAVDRLAAALPTRGIFACSRFVAETQAKLSPKSPLRVVYPGVDLARFDPDSLPAPVQARQTLGLPASGPLLGIVGRLQTWKGMHTLIEAMPGLLRDYPDAYAVLIGGKHDWEPDYPAYLEAKIDALGLQKNIRLTGFQRNVPEWMQAMDVIVHASDREPFGMVIVEAMALGKPVVAGSAGGPTEIITPGKNGLLTPYEDAPALANAILRYLNDPAFAACLGAAARQRAQDFSTARYAENVIATLHELLPESARRGAR